MQVVEGQEGKKACTDFEPCRPRARKFFFSSWHLTWHDGRLRIVLRFAAPAVVLIPTPSHYPQISLTRPPLSPGRP